MTAHTTEDIAIALSPSPLSQPVSQTDKANNILMIVNLSFIMD